MPFGCELMTDSIHFRPQEWFLEELTKFMAINHCKDKTEALHLIFKRYLESTKQKVTLRNIIPSQDKWIYCKRALDNIHISQVPCIYDLIVFQCEYKDCFEQVKKIMGEPTRKTLAKNEIETRDF
jgi:hypothetical protein